MVNLYVMKLTTLKRPMIFGLLALVFLSACQNKPKTLAETPVKAPFKYWTWTTANPERTDASYVAEFEKYAQSRWQISDRYERAVQDPEFVEIDKLEADELIKTVGANN